MKSARTYYARLILTAVMATWALATLRGKSEFGAFMMGAGVAGLAWSTFWALQVKRANQERDAAEARLRWWRDQ